jgi:hypothetical protein
MVAVSPKMPEMSIRPLRQNGHDAQRNPDGGAEKDSIQKSSSEAKNRSRWQKSNYDQTRQVYFTGKGDERYVVQFKVRLNDVRLCLVRATIVLFQWKSEGPKSQNNLRFKEIGVCLISSTIMNNCFFWLYLVLVWSFNIDNYNIGS